MTTPSLPNGTRFVVTETIDCHYADLAITSLGERKNVGPMLCRYRAGPGMEYSVTDINRQFVSVLLATEKAVVVGFKKRTRAVASVRVG